MGFSDQNVQNAALDLPRPSLAEVYHTFVETPIPPPKNPRVRQEPIPDMTFEKCAFTDTDLQTSSLQQNDTFPDDPSFQ